MKLLPLVAGHRGRSRVSRTNDSWLLRDLLGFLPPTKQGINECEEGLDRGEHNKERSDLNGMDKSSDSPHSLPSPASIKTISFVAGCWKICRQGILSLSMLPG